MSRGNQIGVLVGLAVILAGLAWWNWGRTQDTPGSAAADETVKPLQIENPTLRLDLVARLRKLEYTGRHRNIFSASAPPPPPPKNPVKVEPAAPPSPPPLDFPLTFYGIGTNRRTGRRRAFFTNGDDVFVAAQGETLLNRFRVAQIGNNTCEVEEISSGRRATVTMEPPVQP